MKTYENWATGWTRSIGTEVKERRMASKMSADDLSRKCADVGYDIPRNVISNLENGRKQLISVQEIAILARALGCAPVNLLFRAEVGDVEVLPKLTASGFDGSEWFCGLKRLADEVDRPQEKLPVYRELQQAENLIESIKGLGNPTLDTELYHQIFSYVLASARQAERRLGPQDFRPDFVARTGETSTVIQLKLKPGEVDEDTEK